MITLMEGYSQPAMMVSVPEITFRLGQLDFARMLVLETMAIGCWNHCFSQGLLKPVIPNQSWAHQVISRLEYNPAEWRSSHPFHERWMTPGHDLFCGGFLHGATWPFSVLLAVRYCRLTRPEQNEGNTLTSRKPRVHEEVITESLDETAKLTLWKPTFTSRDTWIAWAAQLAWLGGGHRFFEWKMLLTQVVAA